MRKTYALLIGLFCCAIVPAYTQISAYSFAARSGTYTSVTNATAVDLYANGSGVSGAIAIGFDFVFNGVPYAQAVATASGYLSFNTSATSTSVNNLTASAATLRPLIAPLWDSLFKISGSQFNYVTTGTPGSRIFTAEWRNWIWNGTNGGIVVSFQVKLYEGSNKIELWYSSPSEDYNNKGYSASIGIAGSGTGSGNFLSLSNAGASPTVSSSVETTTISTPMTTGQVYSFTPPPALPLDIALAGISTSTSACPNTTTSLSVTIRNAGTNTVNFSGNNAVVKVDVSGPVAQSLAATLGSGTLAPGASQVVAFSPAVSFTTGGTYLFRASVTMASDGNAGNDSSTIASRIITATPPWSEPFATTTLPAGWKNTGWYISPTVSGGLTGNPGYFINKSFFSDTSVGTFTTLPIGPLNNKHQLKFDYRLSNTSSPYGPPAANWGHFKVQVSTDCGNTFTTIDSVTNVGTGWVTKTLSLSAYAGQYVSVRIAPKWTAGNYNLSMDNFLVDTAIAIDIAPTSIITNNTICPGSSVPVSIVIKNNGANAIDFATNNATITVNTTGPVTQTLSATLTTGLLASGASQTVSVTPNASFSTGGTYTFKAVATVAGDENRGNDTLTTTTTIIAATAPWTETFTAATIPAGWSASGWTVGTARGATGNPAPNIYTTLSSTDTTRSFTILPIGQLPANYVLSFDYKLSNYTSPYLTPPAGWGNIKVQISTDCGNTFTTIDSIADANGLWTTKSYSLANYAGQYITIKIVATRTSGYYDVAFDNFYVSPPAPCTAPVIRDTDSSVTATTTRIHFSGSGNSFITEYGPVGFAPGTGSSPGVNGTIVTSTGLTAYLTGLTPGTKYYVYVRQNCTALNNGYSSNSPVDSFTTEGLQNDVPVGAYVLTVNAGCTGAPYTINGATRSANEPAVSCSGSLTGGKVVWFKFVAPTSGFVRVSTDVAGNTLLDTRAALFSAGNAADFSTFQIIACDNDNGVISSNASIFYATGLVPGQYYFIAVDGFNATDTGRFCVQVHEVNTSMMASTGNCNSGQVLSNHLADYKGWLSMTNSNGQLIGNIRSNTTLPNPVSYTSSLYVNTDSVRQVATGEYYLDRNFSIVNNIPSASNYDVQFFLLDTELTRLRNSSATASLSNLNVTRVKTDSTCRAAYVSGGPGNDTLLIQTESGSKNGISWVVVNTDRLSNFYLNAGLSPLPRTYVFTGSGNWSNPANWSDNTPPPAVLPPNCVIEIKPMAGGQCILDISQRISSGDRLRIKSGTNVVIPGAVIIQ